MIMTVSTSIFRKAYQYIWTVYLISYIQPRASIPPNNHGALPQMSRQPPPFCHPTLACLQFFKWRIKRNRASVASEKIFEKMIERLYKANTCLSNLIFIPLIFLPTFMKMCMFFVPNFFQNQRRLSLCFYGCTPLQTGGKSLGMNAPPVLETPKPDFRDCTL